MSTKTQLEIMEAVDTPEKKTVKRSSQYDLLKKQILNLEEGKSLPVKVPVEKTDKVSGFQSNLSQNLKRLGLVVQTTKHTMEDGSLVILVSKGSKNSNKKN